MSLHHGTGSVFFALGRRRATWAVIGAHMALGLFLVWIPLFDVLGFERALASALLSTITAPVLGGVAAEGARSKDTGEPLHWWAAALGWSFVALVPSLAAGLLYETLTLPCDLEQGAQFFILLGGGNLIFGVSLGYTLGVAGLRPLPLGLLVGAIDLGWLAGTLLRLYRHPQIFAYATPLGFWPGSLYDEAIEVTPALWAFRGFGVCLSLAVVLGVRALGFPRSHGSRVGFSLSAVVALALAVWTHTSGGFDLDREDVRRALSRVITTEHFVLHTDPSLPRDDVEALALDHELRWARLRRFFGTAPPGRIASFVYRDPEQKGRLMGASRTQIARPWIQEIHIHGADTPHRVLEHELAHIFAGVLASPPFRIPMLFGVVPNIGLIEGIAVAADDPKQELSLHQWAAAMAQLGKLPEISRSLDPAGFWSIASSRAYTAAGSFVSWLIEQEGIQRFGEVYRGGSFGEAYGRSARELEESWRAYLDEVELSASALRLAEHRFSRPSIFGKVCARDSARTSRLAYARLAAGDLEGAEPELETLYVRARSDPAPLVALGRAYLRRGALDRATELAARALETDGATERQRAEAIELEGEIAWKQGDLAKAASRFERVASLALSQGSMRLQAVRLQALQRTPELRETLRAYLGGELSAGLDLVRLGDLTRAHPNDPVVRYLYARRLEAVGAANEGLRWVNDIEDELPTGALRAEARLLHGRLALAAGDALSAVALFEDVARSGEEPLIRAIAEDWAERARFVARME